MLKERQKQNQLNMNKQDESIRRLAYVIWKNRKYSGESDADDEAKNWALAKMSLCPWELTEEERRKLW